METLRAILVIALYAGTPFLVANAANQCEELTRNFAFDFLFELISKVDLSEPVHTLNMRPAIRLYLLQNALLLMTKIALDNLWVLLYDGATRAEPVTLGQLVHDVTAVALLMGCYEAKVANNYLVLVAVVFPQTDVTLN